MDGLPVDGNCLAGWRANPDQITPMRKTTPRFTRWATGLLVLLLPLGALADDGTPAPISQTEGGMMRHAPTIFLVDQRLERGPAGCGDLIARQPTLGISHRNPVFQREGLR